MSELSREERRRAGRRSTPALRRDELEGACRRLSAALGSSETICKLPHVRAVRRVRLCGADDPHQLVNRVDLLRWRWLDLLRRRFLATAEIGVHRHARCGVESTSPPWNLA
jgi:hypothetical protein